jgi:hypothetical protein
MPWREARADVGDRRHVRREQVPWTGGCDDTNGASRWEVMSRRPLANPTLKKEGALSVTA